MNPWQNVWTPNVYFPWSGSVEQRIEPTANWFFDSIDSNAGDARIEKKAFETASYGRQIGLLTEVVLALCEENQNIDRADKSPLFRLMKIKQAIDEIKQQQAATAAEEIEDKLQWLKKNDAQEYKALSNRLIAMLQSK